MNKSLSIVLTVTDNVSDICLAVTIGFDLITDTIIVCRSVSFTSDISLEFPETLGREKRINSIIKSMEE